jgi:hypothetical protein
MGCGEHDNNFYAKAAKPVTYTAEFSEVLPGFTLRCNATAIAPGASIAAETLSA